MGSNLLIILLIEVTVVEHYSMKAIVLNWIYSFSFFIAIIKWILGCRDMDVRVFTIRGGEEEMRNLLRRFVSKKSLQYKKIYPLCKDHRRTYVVTKGSLGYPYFKKKINICFLKNEYFWLTAGFLWKWRNACKWKQKTHYHILPFLSPSLIPFFPIFKLNLRASILPHSQ